MYIYCPVNRFKPTKTSSVVMHFLSSNTRNILVPKLFGFAKIFRLIFIFSTFLYQRYVTSSNVYDTTSLTF